MSKMHTLHSVRTHLSPAQAAHAAGVSRWTIMRAIKDQRLLAKRDNRNHWNIKTEDLDRWRASTVRTVEAAHSLHTQNDALEMPMRVASLEAENDQLRERLLEVQADRDAWREMAQKRHVWWPWGR